MKSNYYTLKGYKLKENKNITEGMEDYIEMIYRQKKKYITVKSLAERLNVKPPSVSKMANRLKKYNLINFKKYGKISLTDDGLNLGKYLMWRHNVLKIFFKILNKSSYRLKQIEQIEHFVDYITIKNLENLTKKLVNNQIFILKNHNKN